MIISIKVIANAHKNEAVSYKEGVLKVRIQAVREKGKANEMLIKFLSEFFNIPKNQIKIKKGVTAPLKLVEFEGLSSLPSQQLDLLGL